MKKAPLGAFLSGVWCRARYQSFQHPHHHHPVSIRQLSIESNDHALTLSQITQVRLRIRLMDLPLRLNDFETHLHTPSLAVNF